MPESVTKDSLEIQYPPSIVEDVTKLVQRVQTFTGATGAAIALRDGEEMVCRASRGNNAPDVGMMMNLDGTFAGLAVKSMKAVRCDDTETDPRVDSEVSRALRIKSMACVPVLSGMRVSGVIAVFSGTGNAFSDTHMAVLKTMADGLGANIQRYHESHGGSTAAVSAVSAPMASPKPQAPATPPPTPKIEAPKVEAAAPAPAPMAAAAAAAAPAPSAAPAPAVEKPKKQENKQGKWKPVAAPKQEEEKPVVEAKAEVKPEPKPVKEETKTAVAAAPSFSYDTPEAEGSKKGLVIGGVAAAVLVVAAGGYMMMGRGSKTSTAPSTPGTTQSAPSSSSTSSAAPATTTAAASTTSSTAKPQDTTKPSTVALDKTRVLTPQTTETKPAAAPMMVAPAPNKPAQQQSAEEAPPSINIAGGTGPALDIPMTTSAPKLTAPAPANATIVPSRLLQRVNPSYPQTAKQYRIEGAVSLNATIGSDGHVKDAKVVSGPPMLRDAAVNAVRQWKYAPSTVNGRAVESTVQIVLQFKMPS